MEEHQPSHDTRKEMRQAARMVLVIAALSIIAGVYLSIGEETDQSAYVALSLGVTLGWTALISLRNGGKDETETSDHEKSESRP